jgi:hypothetical protein
MISALDIWHALPTPNGAKPQRQALCPDIRIGECEIQDRPRGYCLIQYFLAYDAASRVAEFWRSARVRADCRSAVSKPSPNQPRIGGE